MTKLKPAEASSVLVLFGLLGCALLGLLYYRNQVETARFLLELQVDPALHASQLRVDLRKSISNQDVLELVQAGASRDVIYRMITRSPAQFRVDTSDIVELRKAGVPNDIIGHMIEAMTEGGAVTTASQRDVVALPAKAPVREFEATTH